MWRKRNCKIIFLHIPKTAGQYIHAVLEAAYDKTEIYPGRVNDHLLTSSIDSLNRYNVFSGHFDWSLLDCLKGDKFVFTVLREPMERILSFYFYLHQKGKTLSANELALPHNQGLRAAAELSPDEYFLGSPNHLRNFIDNHFDNFYTYLFATRTFGGRGRAKALIRQGDFSEDQLLDLAIENLTKLDSVVTMSKIRSISKQLRAIKKFKKTSVGSDSPINANIEVPASERLDRLVTMGASPKTIQRLHDYGRLDQMIWRRFL